VSHYLSFLAFALVLALIPGPDMLLTTRSTVMRGRRSGVWTLVGVTVAGAVQGVLAASGLGAVIAASRPVFEAIRWVGVAYLLYLGARALHTAIRDRQAVDLETEPTAGRRWAPLRQGFLCNITNPKVLAFNLSVLPQFVSHDAGLPELLTYALTATAVGMVVLLGVVAAAGAARRIMASRRTRRRLEGVAGVTFVGFAIGLAAEH
jgi:threonine/homoserine/homoserine lactone efflux protein